MSCRRLRRELHGWLRFADVGPGWQPHLDHLATCRGCRDEIGYDRETVRQLRAALVARVDGIEPSPQAWDAIRRRAEAPEPSRGWWSWSSAAIARLRTATAVAGMCLALVAMNLQSVPISWPARSDALAEPPAPAWADGLTPPTERGIRVAPDRRPPARTLPAAERTTVIVAPAWVPAGFGDRFTPPSAAPETSSETTGDPEPAPNDTGPAPDPYGPFLADDRLEVLTRSAPETTTDPAVPEPVEPS